MPRIPYDIVAMQVDHFIIRMAASRSMEQAYYYRSMYTSFLEGCGWSDLEFDNETSRRIDLSWES
jgi:hypothetical protein